MLEPYDAIGFRPNGGYFLKGENMGPEILDTVCPKCGSKEWEYIEKEDADKDYTFCGPYFTVNGTLKAFTCKKCGHSWATERTGKFAAQR
jgi:predicted nucleic-acid-binding Zn-ribbon protein